MLDRVAATLVPAGALAIAEWPWERFDEATARWCFARLRPVASEPGWLARGPGAGRSRARHLLLITVAITAVSIAALAITLLGPEPSGLRP